MNPFDTGIPIDDLAFGSATWLDNERLVITAQAKGANRNVWPPATRVLLLNIATRQLKVVAEDATVMSVDVDGANFVVAPWVDNSGSARQFSVTTAGDVVETGRIELAAPSPPKNPTLPCAEGRVRCNPLARKQDGYLYVDEKTYQKSVHAGLGNELPLMWAQPGKPPISLPLLESDVARTRYLRFLNKYLLDPGQRAPWGLLALDGSVETIPYPSLAVDPQTELFGELLVTRAGVVITKEEKQLRGGTLHGSMLLLLPPDRFVTLVSTSNYLGGSMRIFGLSPDGCSIAYSHHTGFVLSHLLDKGWPPPTLSIVNVCRQK